MLSSTHDPARDGVGVGLADGLLIAEAEADGDGVVGCGAGVDLADARGFEDRLGAGFATTAAASAPVGGGVRAADGETVGVGVPPEPEPVIGRVVLADEADVTGAGSVPLAFR
jgi:hypothetical protein